MSKTASGGETLEYKLYNGNAGSITLAKGQYVFPNIEKAKILPMRDFCFF